MPVNNLTCAICGDEFLAKRSDTKYCSEKCKTRNETIQRATKKRESYKPVIKKCLVCKDAFTANIRNPYQIYCSDICLRQAMHKRAVETGRKKEEYRRYKEKYAELKRKTDLAHKDKIRFSSNKKHVLERDGFKCTECGKEKGLIIHHKDHSGSSENPNNEMDNLVTLCRSCHMRHHASGENSSAFINITKEQILEVRKESSSWREVYRKLGINNTTLIRKRKQFGIF